MDQPSKQTGIKKYLGAMMVPSLMIIILLTKVLGLWKYRVIASMFGTGHDLDSHILDIFWAAFNFPDIIFNVLVAGSVNAALIPIFSQKLATKGDRELIRLMTQFTIVLSIALVCVSLVIYAFAPQISQMMVSGGGLSQFLDINVAEFSIKDVELLTKLMRIMLLSPMFLGISSIMTGYLQVYKRFFVTALAPLFYSLGMVLGAYFFVKYLGWGIEGLSWSVIFGSLLHLLIQLPVFIKYFREHSDNFSEFFKKFDFKEIKYIVKVSAPRALSLFGEQLMVLINTVLGFNVVTGGLSAYKYAFAIHLVPAQIITGSISIMALPELSSLYAKGEIEKFKNLYNKSLQESVFLILPFVAIFAVLRMPIVRLAYGSGNFDWWSTVFTSWSLVLLSLAMLAQVLAAVTLRAYYAIHDTKSPLIHTYLAVAVNLIATYYFINFFSHYSDWRPLIGSMSRDLANGGIFHFITDFGGDILRWFTTRSQSDYAIGGIAVGFTISYLFEAILNMALINPKVKIVSWKETVAPIFLKIGITLVSGLAMYLIYRSTDKFFDTSKVLDVVYVLVVSTFGGGAVYLILCYLLQVKELHVYTNKLKSLLKKVYVKGK
jgi:putative peptidoglycan lipid II flippase